MGEQFPIPFGRYQLTERLAVGGMAELFLANVEGEHGFAKRVVIKRLLPHLAVEQNYTQMFIDEAKITARLVHPKIAQTHELGRVGDELFIAMEYIEGFDGLAMLRECASRREQLEPHLAVWIAREVLDALDFAHNAASENDSSLGVIHRDISPSNVLLSVRGDVKLVDFGIARVHDPSRNDNTKTGTLKGKYGYMSPEQVVEQPLDPRTDLFSIGVVLAEMLTGRRLFAAANELDVLLMVRDAKLSRLDKYGHHLEPGLDRIVRTALKKNLDERWPSAAAFRDALDEWLFTQRQRVSAKMVAELVATLRPGVLAHRAATARARQEGPPAQEASVAESRQPTGDMPDISVEVAMAVEAPEIEIEFAIVPDEVSVARTKSPVVTASGSVQPRPARGVPVIQIPDPGLPLAPISAKPAAESSSIVDLEIDFGNLMDDEPAPVVARTSTSTRQAHDRNVAARTASSERAAAAVSAARTATPPRATTKVLIARTDTGRPTTARTTTRVPGAAKAREVEALHPSASGGYSLGSKIWPKESLDLFADDADLGAEFAANFSSMEAAIDSLAIELPTTEARGAAESAGRPLPQSKVAVAARGTLPPDEAVLATGARGNDSIDDGFGLPANVTPSPLPSSAQLAETPRPLPPSLGEISGEPDDVGELDIIPPLTVLFRLMTAKSTGLLALSAGGVRKEIYFRDGQPEYVASNVASELFGSYLVSKGVMSDGELAMALAMMPHYGGKLGDTLVGLGLLKPLEVFRHLTRQVRSKLIDVCTWSHGQFEWYSGRENLREAFPLDLNTYEVLGAGAMALPVDTLDAWIDSRREKKLRATRAKRIGPERFEIYRLADVFDSLDGSRTVNEILDATADKVERTRTARLLYLLECVDLAQLI